MVTTRARGAAGEARARQYLEAKGYTFLAANWSVKAGEIDLIMQQGDTRVLVEVRLRAPTSYGTGYDTVGEQKKQKLIRTARWYQQKANYWGHLRFDVISIIDVPNSAPAIEHIEHAFGVR